MGDSRKGVGPFADRILDMHQLFGPSLLALALPLFGCAVVVEQGAPREPAAATQSGTPAKAPSSASSPAPNAAPSAPAGRKHSDGKASYYADSLAGNKTGSGEPYDPKAFTAAHRVLPFGTWVEVRRKDGRSVRVRINDRGPFAGRGRVIDLSRAAAEQLGMIREGVVDVDIYMVGK
jgi:rare lipoprotein A